MTLKVFELFVFGCFRTRAVDLFKSGGVRSMLNVLFSILNPQIQGGIWDPKNIYGAAQFNSSILNFRAVTSSLLQTISTVVEIR